MRRKYFEETHRPWFIYGKHPSGRVDLSDGNKDVFVDIPLDTAEALIKARYDYLDTVWEIYMEGQAR
jgi:hypothetical protein